MDRTSQRFFCLSEKVTPIGQAEWTTPGTFQWLCPAGVESVSAVAIGAGTTNGAGGGTGWRAAIATVPGVLYDVKVGAPTTGDGTSLFLSEATVCGRRGSNGPSGSGTVGGTFVGDGGGNGGNSGAVLGNSPSGYGNGGGGAGGYSGNGGRGGASVPNPQASGFDQNGGPGQDGAGGGGGGGGAGWAGIPQPNSGQRYAGGGGGGVGIFGQGSNGVGGAGGKNDGVFGTAGRRGNGGSSGTNGTDGVNGTQTNRTGGNGGLYGAGSGLGGALIYYDQSSDGSANGTSSGGAVRIIWGQGRFYPSTRTANE